MNRPGGDNDSDRERRVGKGWGAKDREKSGAPGAKRGVLIQAYEARVAQKQGRQVRVAHILQFAQVK